MPPLHQAQAAMASTDVLVMGGGPVGLATAIHARLAGLSVRVLEKRAGGVVDKACGEGLMPAGVAALSAMGVQLAPHERHPLRGIRYLDGPWTAQGSFARGAVGWGVRRTALMQALEARACELGAEILRGCAVQECDMGTDSVQVRTSRGDLHASWLVGADGLHSRARAWAGVEATTGTDRRFGVRRHFHMAPWSDHVEVHWQRGVEAYVTPVAPDQVNIAFLWRDDHATFDRLLARFSSLQERVTGVPHSSSPRGAGPFAQVLRSRVSSRIALVGDAAGYLDALTGEGLTLGFRSSAALAQVIARQQPLSQYESAYRRLSLDYYMSTRALLAVGRRPWLRRAVVMALAKVPGAFDRLLAWHGQSAVPATMLDRVIPAGS